MSTSSEKAMLLTYVIFGVLTLVYGIFMLMYLNRAEKCDKFMKDQDRTFRKIAVVVTWVAVILQGLGVLGGLISLMSGSPSPMTAQDVFRQVPVSVGGAAPMTTSDE
jgi:hypothetical protein